MEHRPTSNVADKTPDDARTLAAVDWLMGVQALGLEFANHVEDVRLGAVVDRDVRPSEITFLEALSWILADDCDLYGTTYADPDNPTAIYFQPWAEGDQPILVYE